MSKRIAIIQSSYIPWKGYFDIIRQVDEFVLLDEVQFTKRDWRNRNLIKTPNGLHWLTVPVVTKGRYHQSIQETRISGPWAQQHWETITHSYRRSPGWDTMAPRLGALYDEVRRIDSLSEVNFRFLTGITSLLGIDTQITWSSSYGAQGEKTDRLVSICERASATSYLSGPAARSYLEVEKFTEEGIEVRYMDYEGYPEYPQPFGAFEHRVSIVDLLLCMGPEALNYIKRACVGESRDA